MMIEFKVTRLEQDYQIPDFDCGVDDINKFLIDDSKDYQEGLFAVTYIATNPESHSLISYFCLLNDKLAYLPGEDKKAWNRVNRKIKNHKRMKSYPAVKIGRLGTSLAYAGQGVGAEIISFIKFLFIRNNKTGCRFLTVDAHRDAVGFYLNCGFTFFTETDRDDDTRLMYFDLKPFKDALEGK